MKINYVVPFHVYHHNIYELESISIVQSGNENENYPNSLPPPPPPSPLFTAGPSRHSSVSLWIKVSGISQQTHSTEGWRHSSSGPYYYNPTIHCCWQNKKDGEGLVERTEGFWQVERSK